MGNTSDEEVIIELSRGWSLPKWREMARHKDLLVVLIRRDLVSKYTQTLLGPAWYIAQPVLTSVLFSAIFSGAAGITTDGVPAILFYLCGLLSWGYFVTCLEAISRSLLNNSHLVQKVYFPRILIPISLVISKLYPYAIQLLLMLAFMAYFHLFSPSEYRLHLEPSFWKFPLLLIQTAALGLGVGIWMAALSTRYRDFQHLLNFLIPIWMYLTPIIYPLSMMRERWRQLAYLNPMCTITEEYRKVFFGVGGVPLSAHALSVAITALLLVTGLLAFQRIERSFVDTL